MLVPLKVASFKTPSPKQVNLLAWADHGAFNPDNTMNYYGTYWGKGVGCDEAD